ncbi:Crp/Fnr family transcriptional regulator [Chryseobacterium echinoideorum]|uniref:Crp/Fnr family transcriptional regulator n=1 Tax=Chryseobacterium echinoideorum TaxID=1549648 RepID=UPI001185956C|nr:Crp/Fnr family transcriptional regulator [Chryseobacterium echinoideorum]
MIKEDLLLLFGAEERCYDADDIIFSEGDMPMFFYLIVKGKAKLNNYNDLGKEFIQAIVAPKQSIGLSSLFTEMTYPNNAIAIEKCEILRLPKAIFLKLLEQHHEYYSKIIHCLSEHIHYKFMMMQSMAFHNPSQKLLTLMNYLKFECSEQESFSLQIPLTRQQLASLTGLSVETVIRVVKNLEKQGIVKIQNRKIFY